MASDDELEQRLLADELSDKNEATTVKSMPEVLEHDALLQEISHDLEQEEEVGGTINQQLADIVNKRWSTKLPKTKQKEKMEKYSRPSNCEKLIVPRVNAEIWDKLDNKTKHNDLRATSTQRILAKVGSILTFTTDKLLQMRNAASPDVDQLITMNTDARELHHS